MDDASILQKQQKWPRLFTWPPSKPQRNGTCRSGTGGRCTASCRSCTKTDCPTDTKRSKNGRRDPPAIDMPTGIRYRISNRLMADNTAFYRLSGINPITGNPIYRNSFTYSIFLRIQLLVRVDVADVKQRPCRFISSAQTASPAQQQSYRHN